MERKRKRIEEYKPNKRLKRTNSNLWSGMFDDEITKYDKQQREREALYEENFKNFFNYLINIYRIIKPLVQEKKLSLEDLEKLDLKSVIEEIKEDIEFFDDLIEQNGSKKEFNICLKTIADCYQKVCNQDWFGESLVIFLYQKAFKYYPTLESLSELAIFYGKNRQFDKALELLKVIEDKIAKGELKWYCDRNKYKFFNFFGIILEKKQDFEGAKEKYKLCLELQNERLDRKFKKGLIEIAVTDKKNWKKLLEKYTNLHEILQITYKNKIEELSKKEKSIEDNNLFNFEEI